MHPLVELLGEILLSHDKEVKTADVVDGKKAIGLYFSAHWCPPCRGFTPVLSKAYKEHLKGKGLEIIFVSSDKDANQFKGYYEEMPWLALPYALRDKKDALSAKFKVQGIPTFVILDPKTGALITNDGREAVSEDPEGEKLPWVPPTFEESLGDQFLSNAGAVSAATAKLSDKIVGLYFSAHWCPPCRAFTPGLAKTYKHLKEQGKPFEIVFMSLDKNEEEFKEYLKEMPWLAMPFNKSQRRLAGKYEVEGIPSLIIVNGKNGKIITTDGVARAREDPEGKEFPWKPKPFDRLKGSNVDTVNKNPCLIAFTGKHDTADLVKALDTVATPYAADCEKKDAEPGMSFFYLPDASGGDDDDEVSSIGDGLRRVAEVKNATQLVIIDIGRRQYIHHENTDPSKWTADVISTFYKDWLAGKLKGTKLNL